MDTWTLRGHGDKKGSPHELLSWTSNETQRMSIISCSFQNVKLQFTWARTTLQHWRGPPCLRALIFRFGGHVLGLTVSKKSNRPRVSSANLYDAAWQYDWFCTQQSFCKACSCGSHALKMSRNVKSKRNAKLFETLMRPTRTRKKFEAVLWDHQDSRPKMASSRRLLAVAESAQNML